MEGDEFGSPKASSSGLRQDDQSWAASTNRRPAWRPRPGRFLFLANGLFHLVATLALGRYCPGVVTGTLVYLPYGVLLLRAIARDLRVRPAAVVGAAVIGALPMLAHGYLIVFRGSRLF